MKVLIIDTVPKNRAPYLKAYMEKCEELGIAYRRFIWDRSRNGEIETSGNEIIYHRDCADIGENKFKKLFPFYLLRNTLKGIIRDGGYTHLILVNTVASVAIFDFLKENFKGRYVMDIRDFTYEKWGIYRHIVNGLISDSAFSVISSAGFMRFLAPSSKIICAHNISGIAKVKEKVTLSQRKSNVIGFVGYVRYKNENMALIRSLANSMKYKLLYAGDVMPSCDLESECKIRKIANVEFSGNFDNEKKWELYDHIDMINSLYGTFSLEVTTAIPNRYYDALIYKKPILASRGTFLGELVEKDELGIVVDVFKDDVQNFLDEYIRGFEPEAFEARCNVVLERVIEEQKHYTERIKEFLMGKTEKKYGTETELNERSNWGGLTSYNRVGDMLRGGYGA